MAGGLQVPGMHKTIISPKFFHPQLTYHGLAELSTTLKEGELAVFFRNNHFSTVHRSGGQLFLLVTDQGFLEKSSLVGLKYVQTLVSLHTWMTLVVIALWLLFFFM